MMSLHGELVIGCRKKSTTIVRNSSVEEDLQRTCKRANVASIPLKGMEGKIYARTICNRWLLVFVI